MRIVLASVVWPIFVLHFPRLQLSVQSYLGKDSTANSSSLTFSRKMLRLRVSDYSHPWPHLIEEQNENMTLLLCAYRMEYFFFAVLHVSTLSYNIVYSSDVDIWVNWVTLMTFAISVKLYYIKI